MGRAGKRVTGRAEVVETKIIHHDEQDVGPGLGGKRGRREEESDERG